MVNRTDLVSCPWCEQTHRPVALRPGERALCVTCGKTLAKGTALGGDAPLALALAALVFAGPALLLPFVTLSKCGDSRPSRLLDAALGMWDAGMPELAAVVFICGAVAPLFLLLLLLAAREIKSPDDQGHRWMRVTHQIQHWAMPEVQVLAVLVAFLKLGSLVEVEVGAGLWCYAAMSGAMLAAWRSFDLDPPEGSRCAQAPTSERKS